LLRLGAPIRSAPDPPVRSFAFFHGVLRCAGLKREVGVAQDALICFLAVLPFRDFLTSLAPHVDRRAKMTPYAG